MSSVEQSQNNEDIKELKIKEAKDRLSSEKSDIEKSEKRDIINQQANEELEDDELSEIGRRMTLEERAKDLEIGLQWIRKELLDMREQDQNLSKDIGRLRKKVNQIGDLVDRG